MSATKRDAASRRYFGNFSRVVTQTRAALLAVIDFFHRAGENEKSKEPVNDTRSCVAWSRFPDFPFLSFLDLFPPPLPAASLLFHVIRFRLHRDIFLMTIMRLPIREIRCEFPLSRHNLTFNNAWCKHLRYPRCWNTARETGTSIS